MNKPWDMDPNDTTLVVKERLVQRRNSHQDTPVAKDTTENVTTEMIPIILVSLHQTAWMTTAPLMSPPRTNLIDPNVSSRGEGGATEKRYSKRWRTSSC